MLPDLNRLRLFYHVHVRLSVSEAADDLHITPSAVSQQLKKLEDEIGLPLFTRLHKRLVPTPSGKRLFSLAAPLIEGLKVGMDTLAEGRDEPSGMLRIGAPVEFGSIYLPHVISTYRKRYPKVTFDLELGRPSGLMPGVASGDLDLAFVDTFPIKGQYYGDVGKFSIKPVTEEEVVLACSKQYNQTTLKNDHTYESLTHSWFISQQHSAGALNNWFRHHFNRAAGKLNVVLTVANHQAVVSAVRHHVGLGIIVSHLVWQEIQSGSIIVINASAGQAVNRISIVQLLDKVPTLMEKTFLAHFETAIQKSKTFERLRLQLHGHTTQDTGST